RGDGVAGCAPDRSHAGAHGVAIEVDGTRAAQRLTAAILGSGEAEQIAQDPEQRHLGVGIDVVRDAIDGELDHRLTSSGHAAPVSIHAWNSAPSCAWVPGAAARSAPG